MSNTIGVIGGDFESFAKQLQKQLDELQQYRALGTVEELKTMMNNGAFTGVELAQLAVMQMRLKEYQQLGTVEELREAREKQTPKKVVIRKNESVYMPDRCYCPICGKQQKRTYKNVSQGCYCERCGQRLEWSE